MMSPTYNEQGMIAVVRRTGHSSYYVEKGMGAMGKTPKQLGIEGNYRINGGGQSSYVLGAPQWLTIFNTAFPIWLEVIPLLVSNR